MPVLAEGKEANCYLRASGSCVDACDGAFLVIF
jgi:hypothetical protein